jgi:hypothetical protein
MKYLFLLGMILWMNFVWAFPEMIRHGYTQCTACHVSPSGGGILTQYGRQLASELLSTWSYTDESQFLHSKFGKDLADQGILIGGDVREINTYYKDPNQENSKEFLMMANISGAYQTGNFTGVVSIGQITEPMDKGGLNGNFNSTEYYALMKFTDEIGVRAGRFMPAYGLNLPDHTTAIKEMLSPLVPQFQFDTVEASYLSEHWTILGSVAKTIAGTDPSVEENVGSLNVSYSFLDRMRVGVSYWSGSGSQVDRRIYGLNAILGFTKRFYNMTEIDIENWHQPNSQSGLYALSQLAYEVYRGITPYFQIQHEHDNNADPTTLIKTYGLGCHFYPRPHFELSAQWDKVQSYELWSNQGYFLAHYYF